MEVDECFRSLEAWRAWLAAHPEACAGVPEVAGRILEAGFVEPLTGRRVAAAEISGTDGNWREGLICEGINSRMRAVLGVLEEALRGQHPAGVRIFAAEAVTAFALLLRGRFPRFLGSEYGMDAAAREALFPIVHQDLTALELPSGLFDLVVTNEVLEHVPDLDAALREMARVLRPGGMHVGTHPFQYMMEGGDVRARLVEGRLVHLQAPEYHGNPVDEGGSLVFETPGWDILARARAAGFEDAWMRFVASEAHGVLTGDAAGVFVFCARKGAHAQRVEEAPEDGAVLREALAAVQGEVAALRQRVAGLEGSTSWRMTAPLRLVVRRWRAFSSPGR